MKHGHRPHYSITIKHSAEKEMDSLPEGTFDRVTEALLALEADPRPPGCRKLRGTNEFRIRVGPYRVLYVVNDKESMVEIMAVGHRREVYRGH